MASVIPLEKARRRTDFSEIGLTGIKRYGGQVYEEFLTDLRGPLAARTFREMRDNDDIIGAAFYALEQVIRQASWFVEPYDSSKKHLKAADFLRENMDDMSHSWGDFILEACSCLVFGWSYFELVYKLRKGETNNPNTNSKFKDGKVGIRKIARRMQTTLDEWEFDDFGGIQGMWQSAPPDNNRVFIPIDKSVLFRTKIDGNNPEGRSVLRNAYRVWYIKKNVQMIEAIGVERDLIGLPVLQPPEDFDINDPSNAEVVSFAEKLISHLRRDEQEGVLLPSNWKLELLTSNNTRRQFDTDRIINRYDKRISITLLAQFIMLGMDRVGSFALSNNADDLFKVATQGHVINIAETLNNFVVPKLFSLNPTFRLDGKYPRIVPGKVTTPDLQGLANYINSLGKFNLLPTDESFKHELLRIGRFNEQFERRIGEVRTPFNVTGNTEQTRQTNQNTSTSEPKQDKDKVEVDVDEESEE